MKAIAHTDGGNRKDVACCAAVLLLEDGRVIEEHKLFAGLRWTNNDMEYGGVILALDTACHLGVRSLDIYSDSKLVVNQVRDFYQINFPRLRFYYEEVLKLASKLDSVSISHVHREMNPYPDAICNLEMDRWQGKRIRKWEARLASLRDYPPGGVGVVQTTPSPRFR